MEQQFFASPFDAEVFPALLLVAVLAWIIFYGQRPPPSFWRQLQGHLEQLGIEIDRRFDRERWVRRLPVFSAQTVQGKEAEFIRQRLPRKAPRVRFVLALLFIGGLVWWLTR
jgi:hypothetical protein